MVTTVARAPGVPSSCLRSSQLYERSPLVLQQRHDPFNSELLALALLPPAWHISVDAANHEEATMTVTIKPWRKTTNIYVSEMYDHKNKKTHLFDGTLRNNVLQEGQREEYLKCWRHRGSAFPYQLILDQGPCLRSDISLSNL